MLQENPAREITTLLSQAAVPATNLPAAESAGSLTRREVLAMIDRQNMMRDAIKAVAARR